MYLIKVRRKWWFRTVAEHGPFHSELDALIFAWQNINLDRYTYKVVQLLPPV